MSEPEITVIIPFHAEPKQWIERAIKSVIMQQDAPSFEIICMLDRATPEAIAAVMAIDDPRVKVGTCDFGDLGLTRNEAVKSAQGRYVAFLDGDDLFGCEWLKQAYDYARAFRDAAPDGEKDNLVLHPEYMVMFGSAQFIHRCIGDDAPEYDERDMVQWNLWSALAFAPKSVFERHPYQKVGNGFGFEDFVLNADTLGAGIKHRCPPGSMHAIRMKQNQTSLAARTMATNAVIPAMAIFNKRWVAPVVELDAGDKTIPESVHKQAMYAHHVIGEYQLGIHQEMGVRIYPRQTAYDEQAALRDAIGTAKHAVVVRRLVAGGAEKYAIDWAAALVAAGKETVIIETDPAPQDHPWRERAKAKGIRLIRWTPNEQGKEPEHLRGFIQAELDSLFVCNSPLGWGLLHYNAEVMAKRVFAASFAVIPFGMGFTNCPPFHLQRVPPNLKIITDNQAHADKMIAHRDLPVFVLPPKCTYDGPSKRSSLSKERYRVLWAGRGTPEKRPDLLPSLAAALEGKADVHVWGDVRPMNGPENLKYRGPFDGFEKIDGSYDCYVMTSFVEGMPNTACEAVLAGLPIVGPKVGGLPLLTHDVYEKFDPLTVSQLVLEACANGSPHFAESAVKKWAENFDRDVSALVLG